MEKLFSYRYVILVLVFLGLPFCWTSVKKAVEIDNRLSIWFLQSDPEFQKYEWFKKQFGNDETVFLLIKSADSMLSTAFLLRLQHFTDSVAELPDVKEVLAISSLEVPAGMRLGVRQYVLLSDTKYSKSERESILDKLPELKKQFFNQDLTATALFIQPENDEDFEGQRADLLDNIEGLAKTHLAKETVRFAGIGVIYNALNELSEKEFGIYLSLAYGVIFLVLLIIYRSAVVILFAFAAVFFASYYTLALYGFLGLQLNLMTSLVPVIITLLAVMDVIHIVNQHFQRPDLQDVSGKWALIKVLKPCVFTSLTTMAGFLTLSVSPMPILRYFGLFSALGIFIGLIFSFLLAPIFLPKVKRHEANFRFLNRLLPDYAFFTTRNKRIIFTLTGLLVLAGFYGLFHLKADSDTLAYFPETHSVPTDSRNIEKEWGAYLPIDFLIEPVDSIAFYDAELVNGLVRWTDKVEQQVKGFEGSLGYHSQYKLAFQSRYPSNWEQALKSDGLLQQADKQLKKRYAKLYEGFVNEGNNTARVSLFTKMTTAKNLTQKIDSIKNLAASSLHGLAKVETAGYQPLYAKIIYFVINTQIYSLLAAFCMVFFLLWILLKNLKLAFLSTLINLFPVWIVFGVLGIFSINLDTATASLTAIILSLCVDDTIHFINKFQSIALEEERIEVVLNRTLKTVGMAILVSSIVLFLGFGVMFFASLKTVLYFGSLISIAVMAAFISQMYVFPVLLIWWYQAKKSKISSK